MWRQFLRPLVLSLKCRFLNCLFSSEIFCYSAKMERGASVDNFLSVGFGVVFAETSRLYRGG